MHTKKQLEKYAREALEETGIKEGQIVLDCCCGSGTYTIPAAQLVGEKGLVYAIDISNSKLDDLKQRVDLKKLQNVEIIEKDVESKIPLPDRSVNVIFLYDIFWYFRPTENKLIKLLQEVYRVARLRALVSVYPTHVSSYELEHFKNEMRNKGFRLDSKCSRKLVHEGNLERGRLLNFKKESKKGQKERDEIKGAVQRIRDRKR